MTIKEVENQTGLQRSNIRFYEKEKLLIPARNEQNGYRDYSENDVEDIKKIAYLRTLGLSLEDIRNIMAEKLSLHEAVAARSEKLEEQIEDLHKAKAMCRKLLADEEVGYKELQVEQYVPQLEDYWKANQSVFRFDSVSFLYLWGSLFVWGMITVLCAALILLFYEKLPQQIPVQWSHGEAVSLKGKGFLLIYPAGCIVLRYLFRPILYAKLQVNSYLGEIMTEYLSNYLCFIFFSVEVFTILFVYEVVDNIVLLLAVDTIVLIGIMAVGMSRLNLRGRKRERNGYKSGV